MDEFVFFSSELVEVEGSWYQADEAALDCEAGALMELIGVILQYGEESVLCAVVVGSTVDVEVLLFVLFSEGRQNVRHWFVIGLCE